MNEKDLLDEVEKRGIGYARASIKYGLLGLLIWVILAVIAVVLVLVFIASEKPVKHGDTPEFKKSEQEWEKIRESREKMRKVWEKPTLSPKSKEE